MLSVQQRFNRASQTYDDVADIQKICARRLSEKIIAAGHHNSSVLDLGAGTGCMYEVLSPHLPKSFFTLVDFAPQMLAYAAKKFANDANVYYECADFVTHSFNFHDLIVSNLAFQWVKNWQDVIFKYFQKTRTLAFSCLLDGTFDSWYALLNQNQSNASTPSYPSEEAILKYLKTFDADVVTESEEYTLCFSSPMEFMRYLQALGASKNNVDISFSSMKKILRYAQPIQVRYRVFYGVMQKWSL